MRHNFTADGNSPESHPRTGLTSFVASGTFGGGTATLQMQHAGTWIDITTLSADGVENFQLPALPLRVNLNGATSPDLDASIIPIPGF